MDDAGNGAMIDDERDRHRPARIAGDERARPVDRVDYEKRGLGEPRGIIGGLLGEPAGFGNLRAKARLQEPVDREIRLGDRRTAVLVVDPGAGPRAETEIAHRDLAGKARGFDQRNEGVRRPGLQA